MEDTLTDCLVRVREDLKQLRKVRDFLEKNGEAEEHCSITWRTIEAFNSILSVCSSQNTPETTALDTLLDSFYYLARNNSDNRVWDDFGFELGIICVKILSAIERTDIFENLFCKLLSIIGIISEHNSNVWKAGARQILNVLINKNISLPCLEEILKIYICIIRNIEDFALQEFSSQNLHLLKTLSLLVQRVGDFEIQSDIIELIFLHLSKDTKSMFGFFAPIERKLFQSLQFNDFEGDCRLYLNALNKSRKGCEKKVYSICCHVLYLGGCCVDPPVGRNSIWVDANKDSHRMSIKCADIESSVNRVIYIQFSEVLNVQLENDKTEGNQCLTIKTLSLKGLHTDVMNDDICMMVENMEGVHEFVFFLERTIGEKKRKSKFGGKISRTMDWLLIDRNSPRKEVQDNAITSSEKSGINRILPDVLSLFEKANQATFKKESSSQPKVSSQEIKTSQKSFQEQKTNSQELSPNSFVESLNKHIGMNSPEGRPTFEDSVETIEFTIQRKSTPGKAHKLFRSPEKKFNIIETEELDTFKFIFGENKENNPVLEEKQKIKTYNRKTKTQTSKATDDLSYPRALQDRSNVKTKLSNSQSQDYFRRSSNATKNRRPSLPKLKRSKSGDNSTTEKKEKTSKKRGKIISKSSKNPNEVDSKQLEIQNKNKKEESLEVILKKLERNELGPGEPEKSPEKVGKEIEKNETAEIFQKKFEHTTQRTNQDEVNITRGKKQKLKQNIKPSLLDPNGYAFQRWCQPTTSERSNFWLRKLEATRKPQVVSNNVFDFSEDSDSIFGRNKKKKRRVVYSKRRCRTKKEPKQMSFQDMKSILKTTSPKKEKPSLISSKRVETRQKSQTPPEPLNASPECNAEAVQDSGTPEKTAIDDSERESVISSDDEVMQTKKRDRSDESTSSARGYKKKTKISLPHNLLLVIRRRLQRVEDKDRQHTDEIIQTINKATNHLFNHLQRKDGEKVISYLKKVETVATAYDAETEELELRRRRIQRAILYFKTGCSVSDISESLEDSFSKVRNAMQDLREDKDASKTIDRISNRLNHLIKSEIDKSIKNEWETQRKRLLKCASVFRSDFQEFE